MQLTSWWRAITVVALAASTSAVAERLHIVGAQGVSLPDLEPTSVEKAELRFYPRHVEATYGLKLEEGGQPHSSSAPIVLGQAYLVRGASGEEYRMWIRSVVGDARWVEIHRASSAGDDALGRKEVVGCYRIVSYRVGGAPGAPPPGLALELSRDGSYVMGQARGRWQRRRGALALEGAYAHWGLGELSEREEALRFRFHRGRWEVEVELRREPSDALAERTGAGDSRASPIERASGSCGAPSCATEITPRW